MAILSSRSTATAGRIPDILLPDSLFSNDKLSEEGDTGTGILDVFDRYNFTVNEAEPLEKEVAVDPEMLGKVFENLLPENIRHTSGTYYTPRVIVHYMCQQALLHYLAGRATDIPRDDLALFLRLAELFADFEARETRNTPTSACPSPSHRMPSDWTTSLIPSPSAIPLSVPARSPWE